VGHKKNVQARKNKSHKLGCGATSKDVNLQRSDQSTLRSEKDHEHAFLSIWRVVKGITGGRVSIS